MPIKFRKYISRKMVQSEPTSLFVFGDNLTRMGFGGQAREMRGEPNAVGLPTKKAPGGREEDFFTDGVVEVLPAINAGALYRLQTHLASGGIVIWPEDGIGSGLAELGKRAPKVKEYYDGVLEGLMGIAPNATV